MTKVIKSVQLSCVDVGGKENHNKEYWMDLRDDGMVRVRYGRYTEDSQGNCSFQVDEVKPGGEGFFNKQLKDKTKAGRKSGTYTIRPIDSVGADTIGGTVKSSTPKGNLEDIALKEIKTKDEDVFILIKFLCQINIHSITSQTSVKYDKDTGQFSTATGLLAREGIDTARNVLSDILTHIENTDMTSEEFRLKVNRYLSIIPRDLGRGRVTAAQIFPSRDEVVKQSDILDSIEASLIEAKKPKPVDPDKQKAEEDKEEAQRLFDTALELVTDQKEFNAVKEHFETSAKTEHRTISHLKLKRVYRVEIAEMKNAYDEEGKELGNVHRLWHGTSAANVLSILKSGFLLKPPSTAHIAGNNFGNGLYFAPASTKSLQYASGYWGGGSTTKTYMFLNDVAVGNAYTPPSTTTANPPKGYDSYWAKGGQSGRLINDEVVVFKRSQANPVYLLEFES